MIEKKIQKKLEANLKNAKIFIQDMTGNNDHFNLVAISDSFENLSLIEQHRLIYSLLDGMVTKEIHALQLKTLTWAQWKKQN
tara:strand:- start:127 stop:372 length:246 start_codon:yes stop_codon:yes gene_type:complete